MDGVGPFVNDHLHPIKAAPRRDLEDAIHAVISDRSAGEYYLIMHCLLLLITDYLDRLKIYLNNQELKDKYICGADISGTADEISELIRLLRTHI